MMAGSAVVGAVVSAQLAPAARSVPVADLVMVAAWELNEAVIEASKTSLRMKSLFVMTFEFGLRGKG
jgi:hypothetical protein